MREPEGAQAWRKNNPTPTRTCWRSLTHCTDPDWVNASASRERMRLANESWCLDLAVDTADSIGAENSLERMLAHQMAAMHSANMKLLGELHTELANDRGFDRDPNRGVEMARLANSTARLSETFQKGIEQIRKLRTGGKQTVVVQHVHVNEGGQANVAGKVDRPGRDRVVGEGGENG